MAGFAAPRLSDQGRYTVSTFGKSLPWNAVDAFGLYFVTEILGIDPIVGGALVMFFFMWAAVCDPVAGWLADRTLGSAQAQSRYFTIVTLITMVAFAASFVAFPGPPLAATAFLVAATLVFRTAFAALDVPHNSLMVALTQQGADPVLTSALRLAATILAAWVATLLAKAALEAAPADAPLQFALYAFLLGAAGGVLFLGFLPRATPVGPLPKRLRVMARTEDRPPPWAALGLLFLSSVLLTLVSGIFIKELVYVAKYGFGDPGWAVEAVTAFTIGKLLGIPIWIAVTRRVSPQAALLISYSISALIAGVALAYPPSKSVFATVLVLLGLGLGGANLLSWSLLATIVGGSNALSDRQGKLYGAYTALSKAASGLSGLILGLCLSWLNVGAGGSTDPARFYAVACLAPIVGCAASATCILGMMRIMERNKRSSPTSHL